MAYWWLVGESSWHLDSAHDPCTTWLNSAFVISNHELENGDEITAGGEDQGHRVTETGRRISHRGPAPQHFLKPIWEYSSTPLPQG